MKLRTIKRRRIVRLRQAKRDHRAVCNRLFGRVATFLRKNLEWWREQQLAEARVLRFTQPTDAERNALYMWAPKWHTYKTITKA